VTCAGTVTMAGGLTVKGTTVSAACAEDRVRVSVVPPPSATLESAGTSDTGVGGAGVTVTWLDALEPLRLTVICASPGESAPTETGAVTCPGGTVTVPGTEAMPVWLLDTATSVLVACAAEMLTVSVPFEPCVSNNAVGESPVTVGGAGVMVTAALAEPPLALAVTLVLPAATPVTEIPTVLWPTAKGTDAGTLATP